MSLASRPIPTALVRAPQSALACVQTTPLGRAVVPEVYCTESWRMGTGARSSRLGKPGLSSVSNAVAAALRATSGSAPTSSAVTTILLKATGSARTSAS